ncbi:MAG: hypothetical protein OCC46_15505 [Pseudodesulfovibrio sp.]
MRKLIVSSLFLAVLLVATSPAMADQAEKFKRVKIFDDIIVFVDVDDDTIDALEIKGRAISAFKANMGSMAINNDAYIENYPTQGYEIDNVGYLMIKVMSIRTQGGVNVYHLDFEFGVPPRQVYWDTAMMGVAATGLDLRKEVYEDVDTAMATFATAFKKIRGQ